MTIDAWWTSEDRCGRAFFRSSGLLSHRAGVTNSETILWDKHWCCV